MIYVASPYSAVSKIVESKRAEAVARYTASLIKKGFPAFSPIAHGHFIDQCVHRGAEPDYRDWILHGLGMLRAAVELHVLMLDGWQKSQGVAKEIHYAETKGLPISYISENGYKMNDEFVSVV